MRIRYFGAAAGVILFGLGGGGAISSGRYGGISFLELQLRLLGFPLQLSKDPFLLRL